VSPAPHIKLLPYDKLPIEEFLLGKVPIGTALDRYVPQPPSPDTQIHAVIVVLTIQQVYSSEPDPHFMESFKAIKKLGYEPVVIITGIDEAPCDDAVERARLFLPGQAVINIFPHTNYTSQKHREVSIDYSTRRVLLEALSKAQQFQHQQTVTFNVVVKNNSDQLVELYSVPLGKIESLGSFEILLSKILYKLHPALKNRTEIQDPSSSSNLPVLTLPFHIIVHRLHHSPEYLRYPIPQMSFNDSCTLELILDSKKFPSHVEQNWKVVPTEVGFTINHVQANPPIGMTDY